MSFVSDRRFRIWDYSVSHKQMLLRSPRSPDIATNVDVVMWGVEYLDLPTTLDGLEIAAPSSEEIARVTKFLGNETEPSDVHCFVSGNHRSIVVAYGYKVLENDLDIFESSLEYFAATDPSRDLGEVLAHS